METGKKPLSFSIFRHLSTKQKFHEQFENHVFGHSTSFIASFFLRKSLKMVMPLNNSLLTRLLAGSILGSTWLSQTWAIWKNETLYFLVWSEYPNK